MSQAAKKLAGELRAEWASQHIGEEIVEEIPAEPEKEGGSNCPTGQGTSVKTATGEKHNALFRSSAKANSRSQADKKRRPKPP